MKIGQSISLNQSLQITMQPRQILCNELLQLPLMDLQSALQQELDSNVLLEADGKQENFETPFVADVPAQVQMTPPGGDADPPFNGEEAAQDSSRLGEMMDYFRDSRTSVSSSAGDLPDEFSLENRASISIPWRVQLSEAMRLERVSEGVIQAAEYIVNNLDERGYLKESLEEIADGAEVSLEEAEEALEMVQRVAPAGIAARDLRERLLLLARSLRAQDEDEDEDEDEDTTFRNPVLEKILETYFKEFLDGKFELIKKKLNINDRELKEAIATLKELYAQIPSIEEDAVPARVVPDAKVERDGGRWVVKLQDDAVPRVRLSSYANSLTKQMDTLRPEAKEYLVRQFNRARWMMEALEQRRSTLRKIFEAVVERQQAFFDYGDDALVPLRQEDVAEAISLHPSTISRAVTEKYLECSKGVYPLKHFFPRGIANSRGEQQARNSVQDRLEALVKGENPENPLSDDQLVDMLKREGISISRRTVCKYRDELKIPPATKRKGLARLNR
ncbi:MAG: RNA polymerase factor sigma-54 [Myxococcota bacterium]